MRYASTVVLCCTVVGLVSLGTTVASAAPIGMSTPSSGWRVVSFPQLGQTDYFNDLGNNGHDNLDLIGNAQYPAFYSHFDSGSSTSATDGTLSFRFRLGGYKQNENGYAFVGIDASGDGIPDLYVGSDLLPTGRNMYALPGTQSASVGGTTLTVMSGPASWTHNTTNHNYSPVSAIDAGVPADLDADKGPDRFLSFAVPFADVVGLLAGRNPTIALTDQTILRYVVFTSHTVNGIDQDLMGYGLNYTGVQWSTVTSAATDVSGMVPEPGVVACAAIACSSLLLRKRRPVERFRASKWVVSAAEA